HARTARRTHTTVSAPNDPYETARADKLRRIEELGLDPWGARFDGHAPIQDVLDKQPADRPEDQRPRVKIAGRIVSRRTGGKVHSRHVQDWSGHPVPLRTEGVEGKHEAVEYQALSSRVQVMLGARQVGDVGWKLAQELDLGDLIGVEGAYGKTRTGEPTVFAE